MTDAKHYDIVIWGASGFTGRLVAEYLLNNYPDGKLSWAMAGRNAEKLEAIREEIGDSQGTTPIIIADSKDEASLHAMVEQTKVVISTVGPFAWHGSELVKVCAEAGVGYCDLTGEAQWIHRMLRANEETAKSSGARIVHCCGFDSIPSDIGVHFLQSEAVKAFGEPLKDICLYVMKSKGGFSGGTVHSLTNVMEEAQADPSIGRLLVNPYCLNPDSSKHSPKQPNLKVPRQDDTSGHWLMPFVMAGINTKIVHRSNALKAFAYGENFTYEEVQSTGRGLSGRLKAYAFTGMLAQFMVGLKFKLSRDFMKRFVLPKTGEGPNVDPNDPGMYVLELRGKTADGKTLKARVTGDADPGYGSTCKMLSEAAICLASEAKVEGGFWTPSTAMGDALLQRLHDNAGLTFEIID